MATAKKPTTKLLKLDDIRLDGGTQMRVGLNEETVAEYAEIYQEGGELPPVRVVHDGEAYWLWEGFHRWHSRQRAGLGDIKAEVTSGSQRDAVLMACGANSEHGLKRSNSDKRKAVETLLADKQWAKRSDRWISDMCKVHNSFVAKIRKGATDYVVSSEPREGKDGKSRKAPVKPAEPEAIEDFTKAGDKIDGTGSVEVSAGSPVSGADDDNHADSGSVKQYKDSFDVEAIEAQPASEASIVRDCKGRPVPDRIKPDHTGAALLHSLATKVERLRTELNAISGERGVQRFENHIAPTLDALRLIKDQLRESMFFSECPRCKGEALKLCRRCDGLGFLSVSQSGTLSKEEEAYLSNTAG